MKYGGARRAVNACGTTDKLAGQLITLTSELDAEINFFSLEIGSGTRRNKGLSKA